MFDSTQLRLLPPMLRWRTDAVAAGTSLKGWICGKVVVVDCHYKAKASRPCRDKITKGAVLCYCAKELCAVRQLGYIPLLTRERDQVVVLACATTTRKVLDLAHGTAVQFTRSEKVKTPLLLKVLSPEELGSISGGNVSRQTPRDIRPYLINVLWQDSVLVKHFEPQTRELLGEAPPAPVSNALDSALASPPPAPQNDTAVSQNNPVRKKGSKHAA